MLKEGYRLNSVDFKKVLKNGKRINNNFFSIVYLKSHKTGCSVVVGKKVFKKAVNRNLLRRRVKSVLKQNIKLLKNKKIIVFVRKKVEYDVLKNELQKILLKLNGKSDIYDVE
jgi:ribonuclease P protein component